MPSYKLFGSALVAALSVSAAFAAEPEEHTDKKSGQMVCKRVSETGSLVKKTKVCLTRKEWQRSADNHRKHGEQLQDKLRTRPGN